MQRAFVSWRTWQLKLALVGPAKELGCRPAAGHFQRRIDDFTLFKVESERTYDVRVAGHDRLENDRGCDGDSVCPSARVD